MEKMIMKAYYANAGRLACCRPSDASRQMSGQIMELVLDIFGRRDLVDRCMNILSVTDVLRTAMDCVLLGADELPVPEEYRCYLDMKARCLLEYEVQTPQSYDRTLLTRELLQAALCGDRNALRLSACMDWLSGNRNRAVRCWMILAYTGERFAMQALEYAAGRMDDDKAAALWHQIRLICEETDVCFSLAVPKSGRDREERQAAETAQVILAVRTRCAELQSKLLSIAMIQYAIDSRDDLSTKVRNLYNAPEPYPVMLVNQYQQANKKYGF